MVIHGSFEGTIPQECLICGKDMSFGDEGIFWSCFTSFSMCAECAVHVVPALAKDITKLSQFQGIKQRHAEYLTEAAVDAEYYRELINNNA